MKLKEKNVWHQMLNLSKLVQITRSFQMKIEKKKKKVLKYI